MFYSLECALTKKSYKVYSQITMELNLKSKTAGKSPNIRRLNTLLNNTWVKEIALREIYKYLN